MKYLKKNKCLLLLSMGLLLSVLTGCIAVYTPRSGRVVEKGSGRPIQDAIIVRAWEKRFATVAGSMLSSVVFEETVSDDDGRFSFGPRILFSGIPILHWTEEDPLLVFRPGYASPAPLEKAKLIELSALAPNRYARDTAAREARSAHYLYDTTLLRRAVQQEEALIKELPEVTKGVMYRLHGLNDIAFDSRGNLFLSGWTEIVKLPRTGENYETLSIGKIRTSDQWETEIEISQDQLYVLGVKKLSRIDVSATAGDASPLAPTAFATGKEFVRKAVTMHGSPPKDTPSVVTRREFKNSSQPGVQQKGPKPGPVLEKPQPAQPSVQQKAPKPGPVLEKPQPAPLEPTPASEEPGASPQNIPRPMQEVLVEYSQKNALPQYNYRFAMGADGLIEVGADSYKLNGELIKRRTIDLSVLRNGSQYQVVETLYHDGYLVVALTKTYGFENAVFIFNSENELVAVKKLPVRAPVRGLAAAGERYYACDAESFYVFDRHFSLISRQTVPPELFGEFYLIRIKVDSGGENLFLIDRRYGRLLRYDLRNNDWR